MYDVIKKNNLSIILFLRLPLIIGVIFIHTINITQGTYHIYDFVFKLMTNTLCAVCVPLFFVFSGYLFFINIDKLNINTYKNKLSSRFKTLFIPYIFWNIFYLLIIAIGQWITPSLFSGAFKRVSDFSITDWLSLFYNALGSNQPIAFHLWFIRDLIIMVLLTPIFYYLTKFLKVWWLLIPIFIYVISISGLKSLPLTFFGVGCVSGIKKYSFYIKSSIIKIIVVLLYFILITIEMFISNSFLHRINIIIGCIAILQIVSFLIKDKRVENIWWIKCGISNSSFFIYCYHGIFSLFLCKFVISSGLVYNDVTAVFWYFAIVLIVLTLGILLNKTLEKIAPSFLAFITGGRA